MDNMLYIVAGLIIVLLIAVLIMRRQKAQPTASSTDDTKSKTKRVPTDYDTARTDTAAGATKFDSLTVAERFIDQQRYDKAIEALERGLLQKPHDAKLSLKLLNIYALTSQSENFYRTYESLSAHGDAATIAQAKELKALFDQEHNQTPLQGRSDTNASDAEQPATADYDSLDFDVASVPNETQNLQEDKDNTFQEGATDNDSNLTDADPLSSAPLASSFDDSSVTDNSNNHADAIFDLTLDDLESDSFDEATDDAANHPALDDTGLDSHALSLDEPSVSDSATVPTHSNDSLESVDPISEDLSLDEVSLDFDEPAATDSLSSETADLQPTDRQSDNLQEDFVLDFDDLTADSPSNSDTDISTDTFSDPELAVAEETADASSLDFDLSLDDEDQSDLQPDALSLDSLEQVDAEETVSDADTFAVEENLSSASPSDSSETLTTELDDLDFDLTDAQPTGDKLSTIETSSPLMFDDETPIEDGLGVEDSILEDATTTASPVITEEKTGSSDFAAQFASDFDFVNDLDNQQITLDLAAKYLELGEYDSAKRLLSEVLAQGSSDQQAEAQALLERTV